MGTENITQKILDDAKKRAEEIVSEAEGKVKNILENAHEEAKRIKEKVEKDAEELVKKETTRILSLTELEEKKKILQEKIEILEETFRRALDYFISRSENEYQKIMRGLLIKSVNHGDEEVVVAKSDRNRLDQKFLNSVNEELRKMGKTGNLKLTKEFGDFNAGVLLRKDRVEIWCNFEVLLEMLKGDLEIEIAKFLFQPGE